MSFGILKYSVYQTRLTFILIFYIITPPKNFFAITAIDQEVGLVAIAVCNVG